MSPSGVYCADPGGNQRFRMGSWIGEEDGRETWQNSENFGEKNWREAWQRDWTQRKKKGKNKGRKQIILIRFSIPGKWEEIRKYKEYEIILNIIYILLYYKI